MIRSVIRGCGGYLPEKVVTNDDMSQFVDTSHDWIVERTGIHQRHYAHQNETTSDMAYQAAKIALDMAGIDANEIDLIVIGTVTPDNTFPSCAARVQQKLGNSKALAFDVSAACAGYLVALNVAHNFLNSGTIKKALVIGADKMSALVDMTDRSTCVLFGDGAGAIVLEAQSETEANNRGLIGIDLESNGQYYDLLHMDGGPSSSGTIGKLYMNGGEVFRHAVTKLADSALKILKKHQLECHNIDWLIPHQANIRIIDALMRKLDLDPAKVITTVAQHANTSAASIPLALYEGVKSGRVKPGDMILHEAIGGGLVWGSALLRY